MGGMESLKRLFRLLESHLNRRSKNYESLHNIKGTIIKEWYKK